jgi:hypothetical protein
MEASLRLSAVFATTQREKPGRSLARGESGLGGGADPHAHPGFAAHTYAPALEHGGRDQHRGSQDGYKRFQKVLWEAHQRGGPNAAIVRRNTSSGATMSPHQLEDGLSKADAQMLLHAPVIDGPNSPLFCHLLPSYRGSRWAWPVGPTRPPPFRGRCGWRGTRRTGSRWCSRTEA